MVTKGLIIYLYICSLLLLIFGLCMIFINPVDGLSMGFGGMCIGFAVFFSLLPTFVFIPKYKEQERIKRENELRIQRKQQEKERREKEFEELCASGNWTFQTKDFYNACKNNNIFDLNDNFYFEKAKLLLENIMKTNKVSKKYWNLYNSKKQILKYYDDGKKKVQLEEIKIEKRKTKAFNTPINVDLNKTEKEEKTFLDSLKTTRGTVKCKKMLERKIDQYQKRIIELKNASKAASNLANITMSSAYVQEKNDWATMGGIASGIAGPAAGLAVAQQAILENEKIEIQNEKNKKHAADLAINILGAASDVEEKIRVEANKLEPYKKAYDNLENIMVLKKISVDEIFENLKVSANIIENKLQLNITNNFVPDVPYGVHIVADGTIKVKIKFETSDSNEFVYMEEVIVPLGINGIKCNGGKGSCYNYIKRTVPGKNRNYQFDISPHSLWLMEEVKI